MRPTTQAGPSAASSSAAVPQIAKRRRRARLSIDQLLRAKEIIGILGAPLPTDFTSALVTLPAPGSKRKAESAREAPAKRPRLAGDTGHAPVRKDAPDATASAPVPATPSTSAATAFVPVRRLRLQQRPGRVEMDNRHHRFYNEARALKYSGTSRLSSTYPRNHKHHISLPTPPPEGSPYYTHAVVLARLELVDAMISFCYAMWCRSNPTNPNRPFFDWCQLNDYMQWLKSTVADHEADFVGERERAIFAGLIYMLEAFVCGHWMKSLVQHRVRHDISSAMADMKRAIGEHYQAARTPERPPPQLPSPATNSAHSTPNGPGTPPAGANAAAAPKYEFAKYIPKLFFEKPSGPPPPIAADEVRVKFAPNNVHNLFEQQEVAQRLITASERASRLLALPALARHFPRTFARVIQSSLAPEHEPDVDIDDADGELCWPGQAAAGDGLGWVCLIGKAMVAEFGAEYGYQGLAGVIVKPDPIVPTDTRR